MAKSSDELKRDVEEIGRVVQDAFMSMATQVGDLFADAMDQSADLAEVYAKDIEKSMRSIARSTQDLISLNLKLGKGQLTQRDITQQILKHETKRDALLVSLGAALSSGLITYEQFSQKAAEINEYTDLTIGQMEEMREVVDQIKARMGGFGAIVKGLSKIPIVGDLIDASSALEDMQLAAAKGESVMVAGFKSIGKSIYNNMGPAVFFGIIKAVMELSASLVQTQRALQLSAEATRTFSDNLSRAATASGDVLANRADLLKTNIELNKVSQTGLMLDSQTLLTANKLLKTQALSAQAAGNILQLSRVSGQTFDETLNAQLDGFRAARDQSGVQLDLRAVLDDVNKLHGQVRAQMGGSSKLMTEMVGKAKTLGIELNEVAAASKSLLDFESSISAELEAELLLGRQLNFERARLAALTGDYDTLLDEINANVGDFYEFSQLNVLQQDALAKSLGMSSDQLSDMLFKEADLEAMKAKARRDNNEDLLKQLTAIGIQERFNESVLKLKGAFADAFVSLEPIINGLVSLLSNTSAVYAILGGIAGLSLVKLVTASYSLAANMFMAGGAALTFRGAMMGLAALVGIPLILGAIIGAQNKTKANAEKVPEMNVGSKEILGDGFAYLHKGNTVTPAKTAGPGMSGLTVNDVKGAFLAAMNESAQKPIIIKQADSNYSDGNVMSNQGDNYKIMYEQGFS